MGYASPPTSWLAFKAGEHWQIKSLQTRVPSFRVEVHYTRLGRRARAALHAAGGHHALQYILQLWGTFGVGAKRQCHWQRQRLVSCRSRHRSILL